MNILFAIMIVVFFVVGICGIIGISLDFVHSIYRLTRRFRRCGTGLDTSVAILEGMTADERHTLCIQNYRGVPCLVVHKSDCDALGHPYSSRDAASFVTAITIERIERVIDDFKDRRSMFVDDEETKVGNGE